MAGAVGAVICLTVCTCTGLLARERCRGRLRLLEEEIRMLEAMRLLLEEERLPMDELIAQSASVATEREHPAARLLEQTAHRLTRTPSLTLVDAYERARGEITFVCEQKDERAAMDTLFRQLGQGTAAMRRQAVDAALRRLGDCREKARVKAEQNSSLYARLGVLGGLMLGIVLW